MAQNHVWRYTLRLFHTFSIFEKSRKIDAKREAKSCHFWSKKRPWPDHGRLILRFLRFFENVKKNVDFSMSLWVAKKLEKIAKVLLKGDPDASGLSLLTARVPRAALRATTKWEIETRKRGIRMKGKEEG